MWHGIVHALVTSPWITAMVVLVIGCTVLPIARNLLHDRQPRDPVRRFSRADKRRILARAGHRCERHGLLTGRCRQTAGLEADHVHPWSRGGWTHIDNGQALCRRHNRAKRASVPWNWQLRHLADRRTAYFPPGSSTAVMRHRPRTEAAPHDVGHLRVDRAPLA